MPSDDSIVFAIRNEDDVWDALRHVLGNPRKQQHYEINLLERDWINFKYTLDGEVFKQTITPSVMVGLVDFQRAFYRSVASILKDDGDIRRLTNVEKNRYELVFGVSEGSSQLLAKAGDMADEIIKGAIAKMSGPGVTLAVLLGLVLYFGHTGVENYIQGNIDTRKAEIEAGKDLQQSRMLEGVIREDTEKLRIIAEAVKASATAKEVSEQSKDGYDAIVRHSDRADNINIQGVPLNKQAIDDLTQTSRNQAENLKIVDNFIVKTIDRTAENVFQIKMHSAETGKMMAAVIDDPVLVHKYLKSLQYSLAQEAPIEITLQVRKIGENFQDGKIQKVIRRRT